MPETTRGDRKAPISPTVILVVGVLATSTSAILIRLAQNDAPSVAIAAGRLTVATLIIGPWTAVRRRGELQELSAAGWHAGILSGLMLGFHFAAYILALEYTSIAAATVLATSTPIWVGVAAPIVLNEPVSREIKVGIVMALAGSTVIALDSGTGGSRPLLGNLLALGSALTGAVYFIIGRRLRPRLSLLSYTSIVYGSGALTLILLTLAAGYSLWGYERSTLLLFLLMAVFPQLMGHSSYNYALAYLPAAYVSVAIISEPVGASLLGMLLLAEVPGWPTALGGALILGGILLAGRRGAVPSATG